jgi:hypothetical protein
MMGDGNTEVMVWQRLQPIFSLWRSDRNTEALIQAACGVFAPLPENIVGY